MRIRLASLLLLFALLAGAVPAAAAPLPGAAPSGETLSPAAVPEPLRGLVQGFNRLQADASREMNRQLRAFRDQGSAAAGLWLCLIGFAYGVLHAAGPGHGKLVVSSYFLARRARVMHGLTLAATAALGQALAAILLVGIPVLALDMGRAAVLEQSRVLELVSYGVMTALGVVMLVRGRRHADCCGPDHSHDHNHHHHGKAPRDGRAFGLLALAVGCRPCTGAVILLLFAAANDIAIMGMVAVLAMAAGVTITTSAAGLAGMALRTAVTAASGRRAATLATVERVLSVGSSLFITAAGALFFLATLAQP